ncbi:MAG: formamidopyrimidine-DNA glycosylase [Gemmatimonadaceae bacterium]|jgi:formamidopyrimidine-DNA glycosylase|nr:formamidopyrimidine-DNA glycosylase [Gemmatimonadaceae bacterium]
MPELPDIVAYVEALERHVVGHPLDGIALASPFLLRSVVPPLAAFDGRHVAGASRLGKRVVLSFEGDLHLVLHLMIAGRLRWRPPGGKAPGRAALATFRFAHGWLLLTEAGTTRRASLMAVDGRAALAGLDRGGLEVVGARFEDFEGRLLLENHTLKRSLTDPRLLSGIGNAYSDEILHRARLSPMLTTARTTPAQRRALYDATLAVLEEFTARIRAEVGAGFPETVTAFRPDFAVHGRFGQPCPVCGAPVQRIRYATNETNYCARCQTGDRLLADRALSRLLKEDFPRTLADRDG